MQLSHIYMTSDFNQYCWFKATTGRQNADFHTTSLPLVVALTIIVET